ncbi:homeobox protein transcription factor [Anaeramoeba flamelloides]|uniref:Homeobox protein transcription factor n=1 Tax=Anaeramoeba flamelloides TaxID=1746091 RepID=A0AAV7ZSG9_9EUKA|nr:homeobox protein transcription factor [Anaeramoeba flamelloides]
MDFEYNSSDNQLYGNSENGLFESNLESDLKLNMNNSFSTIESESVSHNKNQMLEEEKNYPNQPLLSLNEFSTLEFNNISYNNESLSFQTEEETPRPLFSPSFRNTSFETYSDLNMDYNDEMNLNTSQNSEIENGDGNYQLYNQLSSDSKAFGDNFLKTNSSLRSPVLNNVIVNTKENLENNNQPNEESENINDNKDYHNNEDTSKRSQPQPQTQTQTQQQKKSKVTEGWNRKTFKVLYGDKKRVKILKIKRKRNKKLNITENTKEILENWFLRHYYDQQGPYPNRISRSILATKTNTPELQVQRWFGQRRRIEKKRWQNGEIQKPIWI